MPKLGRRWEPGAEDPEIGRPRVEGYVDSLSPNADGRDVLDASVGWDCRDCTDRLGHSSSSIFVRNLQFLGFLENFALGIRNLRYDLSSSLGPSKRLKVGFLVQSILNERF
ncbi:hypothetical protein VTG60DRAFT_6405 [Thermothelomyces hinnuleus]